MGTPFRVLAELCERLERTSKRNLMVEMVANLLENLDHDEVEPAVSMILGRAFPRWDSRVLEVGWITLTTIIQRLTKTNWEVFNNAFAKTGDVGSAVKAVFEASKIYRQATLLEKPLTILEVRRSFEGIAEASGIRSRERRERMVEALLSVATPLEAKYLVKILIGEMRTGFYEGLMELAIAKTFHVPLEDVRKACMMMGDIGEVSALLKLRGKEALAHVGFTIFRPVKLMMAQTAKTVKEAIIEHGGKTAFEYKLDGARIQIHKSGGEVKIFSRRLTDVTQSLPEIVELIQREVKAENVILEGEVIAVDDQGNPLPFQHLMRRFKRIHKIEETRGKIPIKFFLFDILYRNGQSLIHKPYMERRKILGETVDEIRLTAQIVTGDVEVAEEFLKQGLSNGHEGLMAKRLNGDYTLGVRGKKWLKVKPVLEPLDLVIVAAEYGYGRRHNWLSDYYLAARDAETDKFHVIGKTFKGLTDKEIMEMTERLKKLVIKEEHRRVIVIPKIVVEVLYNEIQKSPKYESKMALRFARISRIREDKTPEEASTIQKVREIYEKQFQRRGKITKEFVNHDVKPRRSPA